MRHVRNAIPSDHLPQTINELRMPLWSCFAAAALDDHMPNAGRPALPARTGSGSSLTRWSAPVPGRSRFRLWHPDPRQHRRPRGTAPRPICSPSTPGPPSWPTTMPSRYVPAATIRPGHRGRRALRPGRLHHVQPAPARCVRSLPRIPGEERAGTHPPAQRGTRSSIADWRR